MLRIQDITLEGDDYAVTCTATILKQIPEYTGRWVPYGVVTTDNPSEMLRLHEWMHGQYDIAEEVFFGGLLPSEPSHSDRSRKTTG